MTKKEIATLKKKASHYLKKAEDYRDYAEELESQKKELLECLQSIAQGFTESNQPAGWTHSTKLENIAANKVLKFSKLTETKKPRGYLYL